jgi:hypothetical protein
LSVGCFLASVSPAFARTPVEPPPQRAPRDPAAAEALYQAGRELLTKNDWEGACAKFDASMQLDPVASTSINVANCLEHFNKTASAWTELLRARTLNQDTLGDERKKTLDDVITKTITALEPRVPKLRLGLSPRVEGTAVFRDGVELPRGTLDDPIPMDPGEHTLQVRAPGFDAFEKTLSLREGETLALEVALARTPNVAVAPPPAPPAALPVWPFITGSLGVVALGAGLGFRIDGFAAESALDDGCGEDRVCDPAAAYDPSADNRRKNFDFGMFVGLSVAGGATILGTVAGVLIEHFTRSEATSVGRIVPFPQGSGAMWEAQF